ncbi:hypothetical protein M3Y99_01746300 [Aphelenchoides fujianensis]|nr:hypothetical protein M3Y99_01746300 [Aphelenchoides fujianensis]
MSDDKQCCTGGSDHKCKQDAEGNCACEAGCHCDESCKCKNCKCHKHGDAQKTEELSHAAAHETSS